MKYSQVDWVMWLDIPSELVFNDWVKMRKENKAPTSQTAINRAAKWVNLLNGMGYSADLSLSIACDLGWKGMEWVFRNEQRNGFQEAPNRNSISFNKKTRDMTIEDELRTDWAD